MSRANIGLDVESPRVGSALAAIAVSALHGCRSEPVKLSEVAIARVASPSLFLVATKEREAVRRSLLDAGLTLEESHLAIPHFLRVTIGSQQGYRSCGGMHNVRYELAIDGQLAIDLRRKGYTGTCPAGVPDRLSAELYERLALPAVSNGDDR